MESITFDKVFELIDERLAWEETYKPTTDEMDKFVHARYESAVGVLKDLKYRLNLVKEKPNG
jgi:hypothetical protein